MSGTSVVADQQKRGRTVKLPLWLLLAIGGALCGALSWGILVALNAVGADVLGPSFLHPPLITLAGTIPGLLFAAFFGVVLLGGRRRDAGRLLAFVAAGGASYLAAYHVSLLAVSWLAANIWPFPNGVALALGGLIGGGVGSLIFALAAQFLLQLATFRVLKASLIAGTLAGGLLGLLAIDSDDDVPNSLLAILALWQGVYAASLAPLLRSLPSRPPLRLSSGLLGAVSGSLAWEVLVLLHALDLDYGLLPYDHVPIVQPLSTVSGLVFGVVFGAALLRNRGIGVARFLGYVLGSGIGYLAAYHAVHHSVV